MNITGGCHCGEIAFSTDIDESKVALCHCEDCQKMSGAPYRGLVFAEHAKLQLTGNIKEYVKKTAESGNPRVQGFCPDCGTHIYATSVGDADSKVYGIRLGTIDQKTELTPTMEIWFDSKLAWVPEIAATKKIAKQP